MLVVKVELWPGGDGSRAMELGRMGVMNVSDLADVSSYNYAIKEMGGSGKLWQGEVVDYPRMDRSLSVWHLIGCVLRDALEKDLKELDWWRVRNLRSDKGAAEREGEWEGADLPPVLGCSADSLNAEVGE